MIFPISPAARVSNRRESPFTHLIIIPEKTGEEKRREVKKSARENLTSFHNTKYLVNDQIMFPQESF